MPTPSRPPDAGHHDAGGWTRRRLLLAAGLAIGATSGCGAVGDRLGIDVDDVRRDDAPVPRPPVPGPDDDARVVAVEAATRLRDDALAVAGVRPDLAALLTAVAADHDAHLGQLGPLPDGTPDPAAPVVPGPPDPLTLAAAESAAAAELLALLDGLSGPLARLLTSVATSRAVHQLDVAAALAQAPAPPPTTTFGAGGTLDGTVVPTLVDGGLGDATAGADALTALVLAEHAAAYADAVLAVRLVDPARGAAAAAVDLHQRAAERLEGLVRTLGVAAPVVPVAWQTPPLPDAAAAVALAADLELAIAEAASVLVATAEADLRSLAADVVLARTLATRSWRTPVPALPGLAELR